MVTLMCLTQNEILIAFDSKRNVNPIARMSSFLAVVPPVLLVYYIWRLLRVRFSDPIIDRDVSPMMDTKEPESLTRRDVFHTAFLLRQKLPAELVPDILDFAEYWLRTRTSTNEMLCISMHDLHSCVEGGPPEGHPYLTTSSIGKDGLTGLHQVRKVVFTIDSKDQGYSWDSEWHGTYEHSHTWFEATVEDDGTDQPFQGRKITANVHAGREYKTHVISWSRDSNDGDESLWVRNLRRGQVITLRAWAQFPAWENNINSAQIDVYTAAVR